MDNVSTATIVTMGCEAVIAILIPLALLLVWKKRTHASIVPALIGAAVFMVFAMTLEQLLHLVALQLDWSVSRAIKGNMWLYMLYGGLAAGIFEEVGRFCGFSLIKKKFRNRRDSITYGIGHGGFECIYLLGVGMAVNIVLAVLLNNLGPEVFTKTVLAGQSAAADQLIASFSSITPGMAAIAIAERLSALVLHISLSVWVFAAVHYKKFRWLLPAAILYHALVDFSPVLYQYGVLKSLAVTEISVAAVAVGAAVIAVMIYRRLGRFENEAKAAAEQTPEPNAEAQ